MATTYGYRKLYNLLKDASQDLTYPTAFDGGRVSDINIFNEEENRVLIWLLHPRSTGALINQRRINKVWNFTFYVYKQDSQDSNNDDENIILDDCDYIATEYFIRINEWFEENETREFTISGLETLPIVRQTTHILTGLECKFTMELPDDNPYCDIHS